MLGMCAIEVMNGNTPTLESVGQLNRFKDN